MLTRNEISYLDKIPKDKVANIHPFNPKVTKISEKILNSIKNVCPDLKVIHMGASALKISGQNDLDISAFSASTNFNNYLIGLTKLFGKPLHKHDNFIEWEFKKNGLDVQFYLTDPNSETTKRQMKVFGILKNNKNLLNEYEKLKQSMDGKSFREYQEKKYNFYHKILKEVD